ncbi:ATP-binding ABC transporter [Medicago truncatula]|uniref:ATP-binding ABC transporter n=1 Tax=Medicago truncatula TaxID=3880 RepID=G7LG51_MEDTR|nr:ATP-binding ABC transporter [Medicago truncatula]
MLVLALVGGSGSGKINRALDLSDAHSFINNLPDGLDFQEGNRKYRIQLAGGQKQRIAIRYHAIVKNPSVLLLDEALSALNAETTSIAIVEGGSIVETGIRDELISNSNSVLCISFKANLFQVLHSLP